MLLKEEAAAQANASGSDDEEMKIPPKELVEEAEEGLHLMWKDPNVNNLANCNGPGLEANEDVGMNCN
jgi:hypothetical protein